MFPWRIRLQHNITARYIRFLIRDWVSRPIPKLELYGCEGEYNFDWLSKLLCFHCRCSVALSIVTIVVLLKEPSFLQFIDLTSFVFLLPHYRSFEGTLGSNLFENCSYSHWHAFFPSKNTKGIDSPENFTWFVKWAIRGYLKLTQKNLSCTLKCQHISIQKQLD